MDFLQAFKKSLFFYFAVIKWVNTSTHSIFSYNILIGNYTLDLTQPGDVTPPSLSKKRSYVSSITKDFCDVQYFPFSMKLVAILTFDSETC